MKTLILTIMLALTAVSGAVATSQPAAAGPMTALSAMTGMIVGGALHKPK
jgi:hypothetical protein